MIKKRRASVAVSLVIPVYNEAENIAALYQRLNGVAKKLPKVTEVIFVDDGSQDQTVSQLRKHRLLFERKIISLSRNFGHQAALLAGLEVARGKFVVTLDGDLQHPPELIPRMLAQHVKGIDIVLTQRKDDVKTSHFKILTSQLFYSLLNYLSEMPVKQSVSDFRSMNRQTLDALLSLPERRKFLRGMVEWIGFSSIVVPYQAEKRMYGQSKYNFLKMLGLAIHGITSFSVVPLYFSALCSVILFVLAGVYAAYVLYIRVFMGNAVSGWASVLFVNLVIGGLILLMLGLLGIYIAAIYIEVKHRPIYITKEKYE